MKVLFLADVPRIGKRNEVKEVNDGYAANFLFPKKLAQPATADVLKKIEKKKEELRIEKEVEAKLLDKNLESLSGITVVMTKKGNAQGHLFSSIHAKDISAALLKHHRISIDESFIDLEEPIKSFGEFTIPVTIAKKKGAFTLSINPEK